MIWFFLAMTATVSIVGCSSISYFPPESRSVKENTVTLPVARDSFWKQFVSQLSSEFFVINNLDKETGLINVSYSGDPEKFVDCGRIKLSSEENDFPASRGAQRYQQWAGWKVFRIDRQMQLDGRMNIIVHELDSKNTQLTVNTRYILNRRMTTTDSSGQMVGSNNDTATFNYGQDGTFPSVGDDNAPLVCRSTGALERQIIATAQKAAGQRPAGSPRPGGLADDSSFSKTAQSTSCIIEHFTWRNSSGLEMLLLEGVISPTSTQSVHIQYFDANNEFLGNSSARIQPGGSFTTGIDRRNPTNELRIKYACN
jgi:hypothetical protein